MPDYRQSDVAGTKWTRAVRVQIDNPRPSLNQPPRLMFVEEEVVQAGGLEVTNLSANLHVTYDPANPKHVQLYTLMNELYILAREERDAREAAAAAHPPA